MKKELWIPQTIAGAMLLWALYPENSYGYYVLLRWIVCPCFAFAAVQAFSRGKTNWVWILGATAVLFNPLFPVHLNRELWALIDLVAAGVAGVSVFVLKACK